MAQNNNQAVDNRSFSERIATYLSLKAKEKALKDEIKAIEDSIKSGMDALEVSEVKENGFVARVEVGTQRKFDTNRFKSEHADVYEAYRHDVVTHSFKAYVEG